MTVIEQTQCSFSEFWVSPENWKRATKKDLEKPWYVQCYFFDPRYLKKYPKGFPFRKKLNSLKTIEERKEAVRFLLVELKDQLLKGYNPILKKFDSIYNNNLNPNMPFMDAYMEALNLKKCSEAHWKEIKYVLNRLTPLAKTLKLLTIPIKEFKRSDLKRLLDVASFPDYYYNRVVKLISSLYRTLIEYECCEANITRDIYPKKVVKTPRIIPEETEFEQIKQFTQAHYPYFYRFMMIFLYSGARITELFRLQKKDVQLDKQEFTVRIDKGKQAKVTIKVILSVALPFWEDLLKEVKEDNDYLFSAEFKPAPTPVHSEIVRRFWKRHIKNKLNVAADFYSLKHYMLDSLDSETAMLLASHSSKSTTAIYQVHKEKRDREILKQLQIKL